MFKHIAIVSTFAMLMMAAVTAQGQTSDYRTLFTFSAPVMLPGLTLPAGTYVFRLADPNSSRKVINVLSADGKRSLAMLHTIPNRLLRAPQDPEVAFMEAAAGGPLPIKTWWYPGTAIGYEFIYPRSQALTLAKITSEPVLTTNTESTDLETAELARITASGPAAPVVVDDNAAPIAAASGRVQRGEIVVDAGVAPEGQQARADQGPVGPEARTRLPQTASPLPTVALLGGAALVTGFGMLFWRRRTLPITRGQ